MDLRELETYGYTYAYYDTYIKLIYLRSRMYSPLTGRFTTKDSWQGDYNRPLSLNRWNYTHDNPVNFTDPSGHDPWWCEGRPNEQECVDAWVQAQISRNNPAQKPRPTSTPLSIGGCYGGEFCQQYGQDIASRASVLVAANSSGLIAIEPQGFGVINGVYVPYQQFSTSQSTIPYYVCADVVRDVYQYAGFDLQNAVLSSFAPGSLPVPDAASRNAILLQSYLIRLNAAKAGDAYPYVAGEIVLLGDYYDPSPDDPLDGQATHAGVIVHGGNSPDEIIVAQASYGDMRIDYYKLREFVARYSYWVYHQDSLSNGGSDEDAANYASQTRDNTPFNDQAYRVLLHGHP